MNSFPDNFNRESCLKSLDENQLILLENTRKKFYDQINNNITNLREIIILSFDDCLWNKHRKVIVRELLDKFDYLNIETYISKNTQMGKGISIKNATSSRQINKSSEIPDNIINIRINFVIDHK